MDAQTVKQVVARYWTRKRYAVAFEVGLNKGGKLRADIVANSLHDIVAVEVKVTVADYRADKKWTSYGDYCNKLYLAMPRDVYDKVKPKGVGVFVIEENLTIKIYGRTPRRDIDPEVRLNMLARLAYRAADKVQHERKSSSVGSKFIVDKVIEELFRSDLKISRKRAEVRRLVVAKAIKPYVG